MYLAEMQAELYDHFGHGENPPPLVVTRFLRNLNTAYREILAMKGLTKLRRTVLSFTSVANSPYAVLPQAASRIVTILDGDRAPLDEIYLTDSRRWGPQGTVSTPSGYVILNLASPVARDPSTPAELFLTSSSAADGVGVSAHVSGIITGGYQRTTRGPLGGVTPGTIDASVTTWEQITKFFLSNLAKGVVTLTQGSGAGTELARIPIGKSSAKYSRILLFPTSSIAVTYTTDVELHIDDMTSPNEECILPLDFHWLLPCGAMMRELLKREKTVEHSIEKARWKQGISDLKAFVNRPSGAPHQGYPRGHQFSQLGPWFPPGS